MTLPNAHAFHRENKGQAALMKVLSPFEKNAPFAVLQHIEVVARGGDYNRS